MAEISLKCSFISWRMFVMIYVGASLMCERISALEVITQGTVSLWLHQKDQSIPCDVRLEEGERIYAFSWSRMEQEEGEAPSLKTIVKVFKDAVSGSGIESGNFSLSVNRSLVLHRPPTIEDEGLSYVCKVILFGAPKGHQNASTIRVLSAPKEPYPFIPECANGHEYVERTNNTCVIKQEAGTSLNLTCKMSGFRPLVDLRWTNNSHSDIPSYRTLTNNSDGTQSMSVTFEVIASLERQEFSCNVSGEAVSGDRWSVVAVQGVEADGSPLVVIIVIVVAILLVLIVLLIVVILVLKSRKRSRSRAASREQTKHEQLTDLEKGSDIRPKENNHYTLEPVSVVVEEPPVETRLNEGTQTDIPEPLEDEDRMSTEDEEQSQELLSKDDREDSKSVSIGPSQVSSRSDIAHADFGESWVCVSNEEVKRLRAAAKDEDGTAVDDPTPTEDPPQRPGHFRGIAQGFGNLLDTVNNFLRHEA
ncbi:uncharacterized protein LOC121419960 isoform X1 [Lytechinus variegatus]|uniref:uncharacterized protein LOC121419960 isoform X1 n=1 Tax=Lytechinus variegatus TaxID=7654 RepID=UPI001BB10978|nr:uncharacterized protein LOC121419960 isoform X1 [Lytechinus variegatus]